MHATSVNDASVTRAHDLVPTRSVVDNGAMSFHFIVQFEPRLDAEAAFRLELERVAQTSRRERGCVRMDVFATVRPPTVFAIHSEWVDERAFDDHATLPHTRHFMDVTSALLTHPVHGLRLTRVDVA